MDKTIRPQFDDLEDPLEKLANAKTIAKPSPVTGDGEVPPPVEDMKRQAVEIASSRLLVLNKGIYQKVAFDPEEVILTVGSGGNVDIVIDAMGVSADQLALVRIDQERIFMDRDPKNDILFDGFSLFQTKVDIPTKIYIKLGEAWIMFVDLDDMREPAVGMELPFVTDAKGFVTLSESGETVKSSHKPILIGSNDLCDLKIYGDNVLDFHCIVYWNNNGVFVEDLSLGDPGVKLGGNVVDEATQITESTVLTVGDIDVDLQVEGDLEKRLRDILSKIEPEPALCLSSIGEDGTSVELPPPGKPIAMGRASDCDVILHGDSVSRVHCKLLVKQKNISLKDNQSFNKTYVNNQEIHKMNVFPGDFITVGDYTLLLHYKI